MSENYRDRCGSCVYCDLHDKDSWSSACFKCRERGFRVSATEDKCGRYRYDSGRSDSDIEYARSHENGLG